MSDYLTRELNRARVRMAEAEEEALSWKWIGVLLSIGLLFATIAIWGSSYPQQADFRTGGLLACLVPLGWLLLSLFNVVLKRGSDPGLRGCALAVIALLLMAIGVIAGGVVLFVTQVSAMFMGYACILAVGLGFMALARSAYSLLQEPRCP